jgi:hypothetical protein
MEAEHVFPESWYPNGTPRASMVLVPACRKCNGDHGRIEERTFLPLVGGLPCGDPAIRSIIDRALCGGSSCILAAMTVFVRMSNSLARI